MAQLLTDEILNAALENLTSKRHQIDEQINEIRRMMGNSRNGAASTSKSGTRKRTISAEGRRAIAEAQKRRWAAKKADSEPKAAPASSAKPKRRLSAEGRRNIVAALQKRWAAKRANAAKAAPAKKSPAKAAKAKAPAPAATSSNG